MKTLANGVAGENYFASFGKKVCDVFAGAMAGEEKKFEHAAFLKALKERRYCYKTSFNQPQLSSTRLVTPAARGTACWTTPKGGPG